MYKWKLCDPMLAIAFLLLHGDSLLAIYKKSEVQYEHMIRNTYIETYFLIWHFLEIVTNTELIYTWLDTVAHINILIHKKTWSKILWLK